MLTPPFNEARADTPKVPVIVVLVDERVDEFDIPIHVNKPSVDIEAVVAGRRSVLYCQSS